MSREELLAILGALLVSLFVVTILGMLINIKEAIGT